MSTIRFMSFPQTEPPPEFILPIVAVFKKHELAISTRSLPKGLTSDKVLAVVGPDLLDLNFQIEVGKKRSSKIDRPVFFGENGVPTRRYQIDAYQPEWHCGLEVEAGRAWNGNAIYRDLIQAAVMVGVSHLCVAVPNGYRWRSKKHGPQVSPDYERIVSVAQTLYAHSRLRMPYGLTILGY